MEELRGILKIHAAKYPFMEPADAVKLIYQNEFGGGHLIRNVQSCLDYLRREYTETVPDKSVGLYEPIGNGIVRVNLAALDSGDLHWLGQAFLASAELHKGSIGVFEDKLHLLCEVTQEGTFGFDIAALRAYLASYQKAGYPPVSHSDVYRKHYNPAYRVICENITEELCTFAYDNQERSD